MVNLVIKKVDTVVFQKNGGFETSPFGKNSQDLEGRKKKAVTDIYHTIPYHMLGATKKECIVKKQSPACVGNFVLFWCAA